VAGLRPRPDKARDARAGAGHRRRSGGDLEGHARAVAKRNQANAAQSTPSGTSPSSCPSATTASLRPATGRSSTTRPPQATPSIGCSLWPATTGARTRRRWARSTTTSISSARTCASRFEHRKRTQSTNLLKRTFVEVRRHTKIIGRFSGETSAPVAHLGRALELASRGRRGITITPRAVAENQTPPPRPHAHPGPAPDRGGDRRLTLPHSETTSTQVPPTPGTPPQNPRQEPSALAADAGICAGAARESGPYRDRR
jgi:hypothetical protein